MRTKRATRHGVERRAPPRPLSSQLTLPCVRAKRTKPRIRLGSGRIRALPKRRRKWPISSEDLRRRLRITATCRRPAATRLDEPGRLA